MNVLSEEKLFSDIFLSLFFAQSEEQYRIPTFW